MDEYCTLILEKIFVVVSSKKDEAKHIKGMPIFTQIQNVQLI